MTETLCPGTITSESEFQGGLTGACGPNALAAAARWSDQSSVPGTVTMTHYLQQVVNSPNGVSTTGELQRLAQNLGYTVERYPGGDIVQWCAERAGHSAIVAFIGNGQALHDEITGANMDASGLRGHFNCMFGYNSGGASPRFGGRNVPAGFIVADGDNNIVNPIVNGKRQHMGISDVMVYYTAVTYRSAALEDAVAIHSRNETHMIPQGWTDSANGDASVATGVLTAPPNPQKGGQRFNVVKGFRQFVLAYPGGWESGNLPDENEQYMNPLEAGNPALGAGTRQCFRWRVLGWTPAMNVYVTWAGQEIKAIRP